MSQPLHHLRDLVCLVPGRHLRPVDHQDRQAETARRLDLGIGPRAAGILRDDKLDAVLLSTEPYRFTEDHADALERQIGKPVLLVDGEMLSWYGSRAVAGLGYLKHLAMAGI